MRTTACMLALAAAVWAQGRFEKGVFRDAFWELTFSAPELREALLSGMGDFLFQGRAAGGVRVTVRVREAAEERTAEQWIKLAREEWEQERRKFEKVEQSGGRILFSQTRYGVYEEVHGYAFLPRGFHCFEVHAWVDDRTDGAARDIAAALDGLKPGRDPGCGLEALRIAAREGGQPSDPDVLVEAGAAYAMGVAPAPHVPELGLRLLQRARGAVKPEKLETERRYKLEWCGGLALLQLDRAADAAAWFERAEQVPELDADRRRRAAYDLARALSVAERVPEGLEALRRAFDGGMPVGKAQLSKEKELGNLRKDPGWEAFWMDCVDGR